MKQKGRLSFLLLVAIMMVTIVFGLMDGKTVEAAGEVAEVVDLNGNLKGQYGTLPEAFVAAQNGDTIRLLDDIDNSSLTIGYNSGEDNKHIKLDLNSKSLILDTLNVSYSLEIKNGTMTAYINNGSSSGDYGALVVDGAKLILPTGMQWLSDGGMQLKNGSYVELRAGTFNLTKLTMEKDCIFSINCDSGISNYGRPGNGFDAVKDYIPEGYSIGSFQRYSDTIQTILDENGGNATNYVLRYRRLSDSQLTVTLNPDTYVYDGNEKKPAVTVTYDGQTLTENTSYTLTYADNKNAGTASVTIDGINSLHGQIVKNFTIQKANQNAPTGLTPTAETIDGKNDGQIANLATTMEYSVDQTSWIACTGTTLMQLSDGDYYVRYKETNNYYASPSTKVVVAKGVTPSTTGEQTTTEGTTTTEKQTTEEIVTTGEQATTQQTFVEQPDGATTQAGAPKTTQTSKKTDKAVSTGDAYPIAIMITLMLGAGVGITGMIRRRKEK